MEPKGMYDQLVKVVLNHYLRPEVTAVEGLGSDQDRFQFVRDAVESLSHFKLCDRCVGEGWFQHYQHRNNGVCYKCEGVGTKKGHIDNVLELDKKLQESVEPLVKKLKSIAKAAERKAINAAKKRDEHLTKIQELRAQSVAFLSEEDRRAVISFFDNIQELDANYCAKVEQGEQAYDHAFLNLNDFHKSLYDQWHVKGVLSEKQVMAIVSGVKKQAARTQALKSARKFSAGTRYDDIVATVVKMEEVFVQVTQWTQGVTTKVTLVGQNEERIIVKTNAPKLLDKFKASLDNKQAVKLDAVCKWVAPEGTISVFTSRGLRVAGV